MKTKKKKRIYHPFPPPWRQRIGLLANIVEDLQKQIEVGIGWQKKYQKYFGFTLTDKAQAEMVMQLLRYACPDLKKIEIELDDRPTFTFGSFLIRGLVAGTRPKLKRIRL